MLSSGKKITFAMLLWSCQLGLLPAQQAGVITGVVRDAATGERLPFVNVVVNESTGTASIDDGTFEISDLPPGQYRLVASCVGYQQQALHQVEVTPGKKTTVAFELEPLALLGGEVIVTAARRPQAAKLAPASIGLITAEQIRERRIATFDQAFDETPGVLVSRSSGANVQAFSIRGASEVAGGGIGNRVLLLIDGRPALSPESAGALWNLVPVNAIERIEVVKGAYSSLYGSSAMGGVINVITRNPAPEPLTRIHLNYGFYNPAPASTEYSRYNDYHTLETSHSRNLGKFSYLLDAGWKHDDGHREKSGFDLYNFYGKASWAMNGNRHLLISANANQIKNDTPATWLSSRQAYSVADFRKDDYQNRREYNADVYYYALPNANLKYSSRFFYYQNYSRYTFDGDPGNDSTNVNKGKQIVSKSTVRAQRLGNISQLEWFVNGRHSLIIGTDVAFDRVVGLPDTVLYGSHEVVNAGAYVQDELKFTPKLTATVGARVDHYTILGAFNETNFSPKLAGIFLPNKTFSVRMLLAQAFRNPSLAERYIKFEQGGGLRFRPKPDLKSEKLVVSAEAGTKWNFARGTSIDFALFYNRYKDLISFQQISNPLEPLVYEVVNLKKAVMQGFEVAFSQVWEKKARLSVGYTYLDAQDVSGGRLNDDLAYKVKHTLSASVSAFAGDITINVNGRYRSRIREVFIYPGNEPAAALILNAKVTWQITPGWSAYIALDNFTNTQYEELERYRMAGRSYTAGAEFRF